MGSCTTTPPALTEQQRLSMDDLGFVVLERFLSPDKNQRLKAEIDEYLACDRARMPFEFPEHGRLIGDPALMPLITSIMGEGFAFHHLHTARHDAGSPGVHWHHDYEQIPQSNRSHAMVHVFYYLNGLDGTIGDLLLLPKSQRCIWERGVAGELFGNSDIPGSIVIDDLPPGSAVIVNSALLHARRAKPGGTGKPRYFVDSSYCQAGIRWPAYGGLRWRDHLRRCRELGLDQDGVHAHLFDERHFFDGAEAWQRLSAINHGSLMATRNETNA
ncbi:MAG: phytanoyl-CoA dioxygenase [Planctomycetes bacterium]|nr:phytanoyl-CoA dioxygenase [Planctomycetota bacterium]